MRQRCSREICRRVVRFRAAVFLFAAAFLGEAFFLAAVVRDVVFAAACFAGAFLAVLLAVAFFAEAFFRFTVVAVAVFPVAFRFSAMSSCRSVKNLSPVSPEFGRYPLVFNTQGSGQKPQRAGSREKSRLRPRIWVAAKANARLGCSRAP